MAKVELKQPVVDEIIVSLKRHMIESLNTAD